MSNNLVSGSLSAEDEQAIMEAIKTIREKLPFLIDLSKKERKTLVTLGDKSHAFVDQAAEVAVQNPDLLPRSFDINEFQQDIQLLTSLNRIWIAFSQLGELLDDTILAAGSDAYAAARKVYAYTKIDGTGAGLDELKKMMSQRFARSHKSKKPDQKTEI